MDTRGAQMVTGGFFLADDSALEGQQLGKYSILRQIGAGPSTSVFLAQDPFIEREVALKVAPQLLNESAAEREVRQRRFFAEAQHAGALRHPHITTIFDAGVDQGRCYIAMEYVPGSRSLEAYAKADGLLPVGVATRIIAQCARALDFAHRRGTLHRNLNCGNVLVDEQFNIKIADFGAALTRLEGAPLDTDLVGDAANHDNSPEALAAGIAQDLLSLGTMAYRLYTGKIPFAQGPQRPLPLAELRHDTPAILQRILDRALARNPAHRYRSGADLAGDLELVFDFLEEDQQSIQPPDKFALLATLDFFKDYPEEDIWELVHAGEWKSAVAGETLLSEGVSDLSFYVLVEGIVAVEKKGRQLLHLKAGECFGEMALFVDGRRGASIVSLEAVTALKIRSRTIDRLPASTQQRFQRSFLRAMIQRLELVTDLLLAELDKT